MIFIKYNFSCFYLHTLYVRINTFYFDFLNHAKRGKIWKQSNFCFVLDTAFSSIILRKGRTMNCKLYWYPKFYIHVILFVGSNTLEKLIKFLFVKLIVSKRFKNNSTESKYLHMRKFCLSSLRMYINLSPLSYPLISLVIPPGQQQQQPFLELQFL